MTPLILLFTGTKESGATTVQLYDGAAAVGPVDDSADTNWTIVVPSITGDGVHPIKARAIDAASNYSESSPLNVTIDTTAPTAPSAAAIAAGSGWSANYISNTNKAAVKVSGTKSTDTTQIVIDIDDEDTFASPKTTTLSGLGTGTTYADATGIDVTTATALADGNLAIRITASDAAGNTATQTV